MKNQKDILREARIYATKNGTIKYFNCEKCGHRLAIPAFKTSVKCIYCGNIKNEDMIS